MSVFQMSEAQRTNYEQAEIERMWDSEAEELFGDPETLQVGIWRCVSGEIICAEGMCSADCGCCENAVLWESPLNVSGWEPKCPSCGRPAHLVEFLD